MYVVAPLYEEFTRRLVAMASVIEVAPLATQAQDAIVREHLADAEARGATLHGVYPGAVVITGVPEDAKVMREETFGPLCPVVPVADAEEALARANASAYGLTLSVWTRDEARARSLAERAQVGVVTVNNVAMSASMPFAPWSGRGISGGGVTNSPLAILEMVSPKYVLVDHGRDPEPWWFPGDDGALAVARRSLGWISAGLLGRITGVFSLLGVMRARIKAQRAFAKAPEAPREGGP